MPSLSLTQRDLEVVEKIKNPESNPSFVAVVDDLLPKDPGCPESDVYPMVATAERNILLKIQKVEMHAMMLSPGKASEILNVYQSCLGDLNSLIEEYPTYSSARNNRVQLYRRLYGDAMLGGASQHSERLIQTPKEEEVSTAVGIVLDDLETILSLLLPKVYTTPISSHHMKMLASASIQRAILYHTTSKLFGQSKMKIPVFRPESHWSKSDFEASASRDFSIGGFFGNEMAKGLAVATNPTAKLCGQIVGEAMKKEYGLAIEK